MIKGVCYSEDMKTFLLAGCVLMLSIVAGLFLANVNPIEYRSNTLDTEHSLGLCRGIAAESQKACDDYRLTRVGYPLRAELATDDQGLNKEQIINFLIGFMPISILGRIVITKTRAKKE